MSTFLRQLRWGQNGEKLISEYLCAKYNYAVMPVYDVQIGSGKGPQVFTLDSSYAAPDSLMFNIHGARWVEAKQKTAFTWHRITQRFVTGIDLCHYQDYLKVVELSPWQLWLMFLQLDGLAKDTPNGVLSPTGLYGGLIDELRHLENHRSNKHGKGGMVYWEADVLTKFAELDDMKKIILDAREAVA